MSKCLICLLMTIIVVVMLAPGCAKKFGFDPNEDSVISFKLRDLTFEYDRSQFEMIITNTTSIRAYGRVVIADRYEDQRAGVGFDLRSRGSKRIYYENYPPGAEIVVIINKDNVPSETRIILH